MNCHGCEAMHLIADNLGWFHDSKKNIELIMQEKGNEVHKIVTENGIEFFKKVED